ncbi:MAG: translation elongation factor Ts [Rhodospirillales bacterium]
MAQITAALVKELREKTGAGMMDCKKALMENDGDVEAAVDWLRKKGLAAAAKKSGRVAAEGLVAVAADGKAGAVVEVNSETDFVARNENFQTFASQLATTALSGPDTAESLTAATFPGAGHSVAEELTKMIATIGENMVLRRVGRLSVDEGVVAHYVHNQVAPGLGKIAVLVALKSAGDAERLQAFGRQLAMHVAAASPQALSPADVDQENLERERTVLSDQARASGKAPEIIEKMVEGRLRKYYEEVCLLEQIYVVDGESKVKKAVEVFAKDLGSPVEIAAYLRFQLGEGIEKEEDDFAAEVAATAGRG